MDEVELFCQKIGIFKEGKIIAEGTLGELGKLIPGIEIVVIKTPQEAEVIARAQKYNFSYRRYGNDLAFWLPEVLEIKDIIAKFEGIAIEGISCYPVRLEHIYMEVTQGVTNSAHSLLPAAPEK